MDKRKIVSALCYGISGLIFLGIYIWGAFFLNPGDEMGYSLLNFYLLMPLTSLTASIILGAKSGFLRWLYPVCFGILGALIPYAVFHSSAGSIVILFALIPSVSGLLIGAGIKKIRQKLNLKGSII